MRIGAQLYTVTKYCQSERDFARSAERVAKMGYEIVQVSGVSESIAPETVRKICDDNGLSIVLTHENPNAVMFDTDRILEKNDILGCPHIGIGGLPGQYRSAEWIKHFADDVKPAAQKIAAAGKQLMYHNHSFEFTKFHAEGVDGTGQKRMIEYLLDWTTPEEMGFTLDTYWVQYAGADVCQWIEKLKDRLACVHLKDMAAGLDNNPFMVPVGEGNLNMQGIMAALEKTNCKYALVEQDTCIGSPFDCLQTSYKNLVKMGYR